MLAGCNSAIIVGPQYCYSEMLMAYLHKDFSVMPGVKTVWCHCGEISGLGPGQVTENIRVFAGWGGW